MDLPQTTQQQETELLSLNEAIGEAVASVVEAQTPEVDLSHLTKAEIVEYAETTYGVELDPHLRKAELIAAAEELQVAAVEAPVEAPVEEVLLEAPVVEAIMEAPVVEAPVVESLVEALLVEAPVVEAPVASVELTPQFSANTVVEPKIGAPKRREGLIEAPTFGIVRGVYCSEEEELNRTQQST